MVRRRTPHLDGSHNDRPVRSEDIGGLCDSAACSVPTSIPSASVAGRGECGTWGQRLPEGESPETAEQISRRNRLGRLASNSVCSNPASRASLSPPGGRRARREPQPSGAAAAQSVAGRVDAGADSIEAGRQLNRTPPVKSLAAGPGPLGARHGERRIIPTRGAR